MIQLQTQQKNIISSNNINYYDQLHLERCGTCSKSKKEFYIFEHLLLYTDGLLCIFLHNMSRVHSAVIFQVSVILKYDKQSNNSFYDNCLKYYNR